MSRFCEQEPRPDETIVDLKVADIIQGTFVRRGLDIDRVNMFRETIQEGRKDEITPIICEQMPDGIYRRIGAHRLTAHVQEQQETIRAVLRTYENDADRRMAEFDSNWGGPLPPSPEDQRYFVNRMVKDNVIPDHEQLMQIMALRLGEARARRMVYDAVAKARRETVATEAKRRNELEAEGKPYEPPEGVTAEDLARYAKERDDNHAPTFGTLRAQLSQATQKFRTTIERITKTSHDSIEASTLSKEDAMVLVADLTTTITYLNHDLGDWKRRLAFDFNDKEAFFRPRGRPRKTQQIADNRRRHGDRNRRSEGTGS